MMPAPWGATLSGNPFWEHSPRHTQRSRVAGSLGVLYPGKLMHPVSHCEPQRSLGERLVGGGGVPGLAEMRLLLFAGD